MNSKFMCAIAFSLGAAVGAAVSWRILKPTYERIANEEIESVKEYYSNKYASDDEHEDSNESAYEEALKKYNTESTARESEKEEDDSMKPHVISPDEFAEIEDYETTSLYYFSDEILTHLNGEVVEDVEALVGADFSEHFGEDEDDSVFVRNDRLKCDFEILRDSTRYSDSDKFEDPRQAED